MSAFTPLTVILGLVPGIHVFWALRFQGADGRNECGHDARELRRTFRNGSAR
jgi:hypothetical protein